MTAYALAQLTIHDRHRYGRYVRRFGEVLARYGGTLLVADEHPEVREGEWHADKVVLIEFPDRSELDRWAGSAEYREIAEDRLAAATATVLVLEGVSSRDRRAGTAAQD